MAVFSISGQGTWRMLVSFLLARLSARRLLCAAADHNRLFHSPSDPRLNGTSFSVCQRCGTSHHSGLAGVSDSHFEILACNHQVIPDPRNSEYVVGVRLSWYTATVVHTKDEATAVLLFARHRRIPGHTRVLVPGVVTMLRGSHMPAYVFDVSRDSAVPAVPQQRSGRAIPAR